MAYLPAYLLDHHRVPSRFANTQVDLNTNGTKGREVKEDTMYVINAELLQWSAP